jgi:hypothetical protein
VTDPTLISALLDLERDRNAAPAFLDARMRAFDELLRLSYPMRLFVEPALVDHVRRLRASHPTEVIPFDRDALLRLPHAARCEAARRDPAWRGQSDALAESAKAVVPGLLAMGLQKIPWLCALAAEDPFGSRRFAWVDADLGLHPGCRTLLAALADPDFGSGGVGALTAEVGEGMELHGLPRHAFTRLCEADRVSFDVSGALVAGERPALERLGAAFESLLEAILGAGLLGSESGLLAILAHREADLFSTRPLRPPPAPRPRAPRLLRRLRRARWRWQRYRIDDRAPPGPRIRLDRDGVEIHSVVCARDVAKSLWSLSSFVAQTGLRPRVVIHDDGTLTPRDHRRYQRYFEAIEILDAKATDARMHEALAAWPVARRLRARPDFYCARKLFDILFTARSEHVLVLDSDVLFFQRPDRLLACMAERRPCFGSDYQSSYAASRLELERWWGQEVLACVNAGLLHVPVRAYRDRLDLVEDYLAFAEKALSHRRLNHHEQTAHALLMTSLGAERLPSTYRVCGPLDGRVVSHHFVDDGRQRERFWRLGVPRVRRDVAAGLRSVRNASEARGEIFATVCTDANPRLDWQCELLEHTWRAVGQPGRFVRLVAARDSEPLPVHRHARVVRTPYANVHPATHDDYPPYNRLFSFDAWLRDEKPEGTVLILDPDCVFRARLAAEVSPGRPRAQRWLGFDRWRERLREHDVTGIDPETLQPVTWPALIHTRDLARLVPRWLEWTAAMRGRLGRWESDMVAFSIASREVGITWSIETLCAWMNWPEREVAGAPLVHYCQPVEGRDGAILWYKRDYRPWSRIAADPREARLDYCRDLLRIVDDYARLRRTRGDSA